MVCCHRVRYRSKKHNDKVEIVGDIWQKAQEFMHREGPNMVVGHVGTADDLYLFEKRMESKVLSTYFCLHDLL